MDEFFKVIGVLVLLALLIFLGPLVVMIGWNCAREAWPMLPVLSYWQVFWMTNGLSLIFKTTTTGRYKND